MAHSAETKAQAMALLMLGNAPRYVVEQTGVPYATVKRWQGQAFADLRSIIGPIDLKHFTFPQRMDTKKKGD
jgi:hypothetical protein